MPALYPEGLKLDPDQATRYALPRVSVWRQGPNPALQVRMSRNLPSDHHLLFPPLFFRSRVQTSLLSTLRSPRLTVFLNPKYLHLHLPDLSTPFRRPSSIASFIHKAYDVGFQIAHSVSLYIRSSSSTAAELVKWSPIIRFLNPTELRIITPDPRPNLRVPTALGISTLGDVPHGASLAWLRCEGPGSVLIGLWDRRALSFDPDEEEMRSHDEVGYAKLALPVGSHIHSWPRKEPANVLLVIHTNDGTSRDFTWRTEDQVAQRLLDPAYLKDDRIVAISLRWKPK